MKRNNSEPNRGKTMEHVVVYHVFPSDNCNFSCAHHWGAGNATIFHQHLKSPLAQTPEKLPGAKAIKLEIPKPNGHLEKTYHSFMDIHGGALCIAIFDLGRLSLFPFLLGQLRVNLLTINLPSVGVPHPRSTAIYIESSPPLTTH